MGTRKTTPIRFKISEEWQTVVLLDIVQLHLHHEDADADNRLRPPWLIAYCTVPDHHNYIYVYMVVENRLFLKSPKSIYMVDVNWLQNSHFFAPAARILRQTKGLSDFMDFYRRRRRLFRVFVFILNGFTVKTSIFEGFWTSKSTNFRLRRSPVNFHQFI